MERNIREVGHHRRQCPKLEKGGEKEKEKKETLQAIGSGDDKLSEDKRPQWSAREEIATLGLEETEVESVEPAQEVPRKCRVLVTFTAIKKSGSKVNSVVLRGGRLRFMGREEVILIGKRTRDH